MSISGASPENTGNDLALQGESAHIQNAEPPQTSLLDRPVESEVGP